MLIGNKNDLVEERAVDYETGANFAKNNDLGYYETSAKTGDNVNRAFNTLIDGYLYLSCLIKLVMYH